MSEPLNFNFSLPVLLKNGDAIITAAEANTVTLATRLPAGFIAATRALIKQVGDHDAAQKGQGAVGGTLTTEQETDLYAVNILVGNLRETAKQAFKGNNVKLRDEFHVGINKPTDLASILQRARILLASAQKADNVAALKACGWIAIDNTGLSDAIAALDTADNVQEYYAFGSTSARNRTANELYGRLLAIQNAASLQWPDDGSGNEVIRAKFRLELFPPCFYGSAKPATQPTLAPVAANPQW